MPNKLLKALFAAELILILIVVALAIADNKHQELPTAHVIKNTDIGNISFRLLTKAVCEEKSENILCRDELFLKCSDKEYLISNYSPESFIECNNIKLNLSDIEVDGKTKFKRGWADPRNIQS